MYTHITNTSAFISTPSLIVAAPRCKIDHLTDNDKLTISYHFYYTIILILLGSSSFMI